MVKFDELLTSLGGFGFYQKRLVALLVFSYMFHPLQNMLAVFILSNHTHRCQDKDTSFNLSESSPETSFTVLNDKRNFSSSQSSCFVTFHDNLTNATLKQQKCTSWSYDTTERTSTPISDFNLVCDDAIKASHAGMVSFLGMLVSSVFSGALGDMFGRKPVVCITLVFLCIPSIGIAWATNIYMYIILRFLTGLGLNFGPSQLLALEMVGPKWRFFTVTLFALAFSAAEFILCGLAFLVRDWRKLQLILSIPSIICLFYFFLLPESVRWSHLHGKIKETHSTLRRISFDNKTALPVNLNIEKEERHHNTKDEFFRLLKSSILLRRLFIMCYITFTDGLLFIGFSFTIGLLEGDVYTNFLVSIILELVGKILVLVISVKVGRKPIIQTAFLFTGMLSVVSAFCTLYLESTFGNWIALISTVIGRMCATAILATLITFSSELFPTSIRTLTISANYIMYDLGCLVSPYVANLATLVDFRFGKVLPAVIFGTIAIAGGLLCFLLPETLNKDLPQEVSDVKNEIIRYSNPGEEVVSTHL